MRLILAASFLALSAMPALADNIANCEVVLMERIEQEGLEGAAEVASFRPAGDFLASVYSDDEGSEVLREIDGLPIRAVMCERQSLVPSLRDFPIAATGIPFMISQHFDSTETGLTTIFFKDGEFQHSYKGPELDADIQAELNDRIEVYNFQPHDLAEKEAAMKAKESAPEDAIDESPYDESAAEDTVEENAEVEIVEAEFVEAEFVEGEDLSIALTDEAALTETLLEETQLEQTPLEEASTEIFLSADDIVAESANEEILDLE